LAGGAHSVRALAEDETFHPVIGPVAEAQALYVDQLQLVERVGAATGEFVIWDVGLGAAANALTVLRATRHLPCPIVLASFDQTLEPLRFGLAHAPLLGYFAGYEASAHELLHRRAARFQDGARAVAWEVHVADFPALVAETAARLPERGLPAPHAILFDAFSPAKNPEMWSLRLFANVFRLLDAARPCVLPTYSRSTMLRVTLLLAGFFVGRGHATGEKEETTIAANSLTLLRHPLDTAWLQRARRSTSAEPLRGAPYRQARMSPETWERLLDHPQFRGPG
jgi:tRNA U34 5-methylaminomethyl-2-thiouridine-forming methyltransferase MnmC